MLWKDTDSASSGRNINLLDSYVGGEELLEQVKNVEKRKKETNLVRRSEWEGHGSLRDLRGASESDFADSSGGLQHSRPLENKKMNNSRPQKRKEKQITKQEAN